ncbi:TonB-dependent siderophore receptor [Luteolibacter arcticus]|uniref:TonB-dependent siderophore receptor n=1 Tax=Luteolibacter arcticus TaxID=1581411 RepID=A0ABT3GI85_9BACT|nr:TonB-dependent siderophore receptor [Luteolibacter arcticus]MCW1923204.1 TonB-dependent siderophore receptor [Luteolibacter arcticus]
MNHHDTSLRSSRLPEGFVFTGTLFALGQLAAQTPATTAEKKEEPKTENLGEMVVQADLEKSLYKPERLQSPKVTQPLRDVAQTVTVIPAEVMKEQAASNLRDVLRNVPGISMQAGEGGGGPAGDNLAIRGFAARSDIFVDGMRDTSSGGYSRDPFNFEQVEVTKGPSSASTGRGSTGGSINIVTKTPHLDNSYGGTLSGGTDNYMRGTFDLNQEFAGCGAFRLNGVYHDQDIPGRDGVENERWGIAPSISWGLGTDTRFTLSYMHLDQENTPDYGIPWVPRTSVNPALPPGIPPVDFERWYGNPVRDYEKVQTDLITGIFEHDFNDKLKLRSTLRYGRNDRDSIYTAPRFVNGTFPTTTLNQQLQSREQIDDALFSQTDIRYDFNTGSVEHNMVGGMEIGRETSRLYGRGNFVPGSMTAAPTPQIDLITGEVLVPFTGIIRRNGAITDTVSDTLAFYLFDTATINEHWEITGGVRWDSYDVDYYGRGADTATTTGVATPLQRDDSMFSYRGAITYKPCEEGSIYLAYGTSFNPGTENLTYIAAPTYGVNPADPTGPLIPTNNSINLFNVDPEENETIELGAKWEFFDEKLLLTGAIFRTEKTNARTTDPTDATVVALTGEQVVEGFELGFTGSITENWRVMGGYTYLSSEVKASGVPLEVGSEISNTPENSFSLWTVYDLPKGFSVGIGTQYVDSRFNNNNVATRQEAPDFTVVNAMASYAMNENVTFQLNVDNLFEEDYIDRVGGGHFVPGQGRSAIVSATLNF